VADEGKMQLTTDDLLEVCHALQRFALNPVSRALIMAHDYPKIAAALLHEMKEPTRTKYKAKALSLVTEIFPASTT
jgi:hypothetical protein